MCKQYGFRRLQFQEIIQQCDSLLRYSKDKQVLKKAKESKQRAELYLCRLEKERPQP